MQAADMDCVVFATLSPDVDMPASACLLQDRLDIERAHRRGNVVRLVAYDHTSLLGGKGTARPHNVLHQCPPASPVQRLGQGGLQPGALPRGQNDDGEI